MRQRLKQIFFILGLGILCSGCNYRCEVPSPFNLIWKRPKDLPSLANLPGFVRWVLPSFLTDPLDVPTRFVYTRTDAPNVHISIRTRAAGKGGLTDFQIALLKDTLNKLPPNQLLTVHEITALPLDLKDHTAYARPDGTIVLDSKRLAGPSAFQNTLIHEIGHEVEFFRLSDKETQQWRDCHNRSSDPLDSVSDYARTNQCEDYAETYKTWATQTDNFAFNAVDAVKKGHYGLLQKFLLCPRCLPIRTAR